MIDIGTAPQFLTLGRRDGGVFDNEGFFAMQLFEVAAQKGNASKKELGSRLDYGTT